MSLFYPFHVAAAAIRETVKRFGRSAHWRVVEKNHLESYPECAACGGAKRLQVHHIEPFHLRPELELEPTNLITLCMGRLECHLTIGHGGSFRAFNPNVVRDAEHFRRRTWSRVSIIRWAKRARLFEVTHG